MTTTTTTARTTSWRAAGGPRRTAVRPPTGRGAARPSRGRPAHPRGRRRSSNSGRRCRRRLRDESAWPADRELLYFVDVQASQTASGLILQLAYRDRKKNGEWAKPRTQRLPVRDAERLPNPLDRQILSLLTGPRARTGIATVTTTITPITIPWLPAISSGLLNEKPCCRWCARPVAATYASLPMSRSRAHCIGMMDRPGSSGWR